MSQHYFHTPYQDSHVTVTLGWDRPLGHFFMVVEKDLPESSETDEAAEATEFRDVDESDGGSDLAEDDSIVYSNLYEPNAFNLTLEDFKARLEQLGITVPEAMFEQVALDELFCVGNRFAWYEPDGTYREQHP